MSYHTGNQLVDPKLIYEKAHIQTGMHVADFGCGRTGHFVFPTAIKVGMEGAVFAVDIQQDVLENVQKRADMEALVNVHTVWSNLEMVGKTAIPEGSLDVVFVVNTLTQSDNRHAVLEEAKRLLKSKGRIVIVDWRKKGLSFSPADERFVDFADLINWGRMHGMALQEEFNVGEYMYGVVLYRNE